MFLIILQTNDPFRKGGLRTFGTGNQISKGAFEAGQPDRAVQARSFTHHPHPERYYYSLHQCCQYTRSQRVCSYFPELSRRTWTEQPLFLFPMFFFLSPPLFHHSVSQQQKSHQLIEGTFLTFSSWKWWDMEKTTVWERRKLDPAGCKTIWNEVSLKRK